jgi:flagellar biosynthesis/type III secretory pathway protein FliH
VSVVPAAPFLVDFGSPELVSAIAEELPLEALAAGAEIDWAERVEEAYARGLDEGKRSAEAETVVLLEEQKAALEQSLATAREAWCTEQGPRLAEQIGTAIRDMEGRIAESAERVLRPFLAQAVRDQAIGQLREIVDDLTATNPGITLEISGPDDLLSAMRTSLSSSVANASYVVNEACDVQVKAGASVIETRISAWLKSSEAQVT